MGSVQSSPATQARYLRKQEQLLDAAKAVAVFQLTYAVLFAQLGVVSSKLAAKRALLAYDSIFARRLAQK